MRGGPRGQLTGSGPPGEAGPRRSTAAAADAQQGADADAGAHDERYAAGKAGGHVIRGGSLRVAGSIAGVLAGAISAPLVVRHLGLANYGRYLTVASVIFVITALSEGGLANVAVRLYSTGDPGEKRAIVENLTGLRIALGFLGGLAAVGFGLIAGYDEVVILGLALGAVGYLLAAVQGSYSVALSGALRLPALAGIDLLRSLLTAAILIALVIADGELAVFFLVTVAVQGCAMVVTAWLVHREVPLRPALDGTRWRLLFRETALYAAAATLGAVYFQVALIAMSLLSSAHQTGLYAISFRIVEIVNGVPWLLAGSVLPLLSVAAASDRARLRFVSGRVFEGAVIAGGLIALGLIVGASFGIRFIAGAKGVGAIPVLRIMALGVTATFIVASWGFVLLSLKRYRALVVANAVALVFALALSGILIPLFDAQGGAATTAALEISLALAYIVLLRREGISPAGRFVGSFALAIACGLGVGLLLLQFVHAIVAVAVACLVYLGVLAALRAIPSELIDAIPWPRSSQSA